MRLRKGSPSGTNTGTKKAGHCPASLFCDPQLIQHEGVHFCRFAIAAEAAGFTAVPRFHIGAEEDGVAAGVHVTQAGDVFRRFPVLHLRVP